MSFLKKHIYFSIILLVLLISKKTYAQPDRYWSVSFNTEASMLAGAVVGDNSDITSIYFNPAGISQIEDQKLVLNANLFRLDFETYGNYFGSKDKINDWGFRVQPRFISYTFRSKKNTKLSFQYAIFNRNYEEKSIYTQTTKPSSIFHPHVGEQILKNYDYTSSYADYWGGIGLSYQINSKFTVGISLLGSVKTFNYNKNIFIIISPDKDLLPDSISNYNVRLDSYERVIMYDVRMLAKIGFKYKIKKWSFGINFTLPSISIMGNADVKRKIEYTDIPKNNNPAETVLINEYAQYREAEFKDPFSCSVGFVYTSPSSKSQYYFTSEYFKGIDSYLAVDGENSVYGNEYPNGSGFSSYKFGTKDIVNVAVGYKREISENFDLILGARTDFNAYKVSNNIKFDEINEIDKVHNNLYHFTLGSIFNYKKASFILGFENTIGVKQNIDPLLNIDNYGDEELNNNNNNKETMNYSIFSIGLFLGFSLDF